MKTLTQKTGSGMSNKPPVVGTVAYYVEAFLLAQRAARHSANTIRYYRVDLERLVWFLREFGYPSQFKKITASVVRQFFVYLSETHEGRWGSSAPGANRPLSPGGIHAFARAIRAFFIWASREARCPCPFDDVEMPKLPRQRGVEAYTTEEVIKLFRATEQSPSGYLRARNRAMLAVLLDTGLRASELLSLTVSSVEEGGRSFKVSGKGEAERWVVMGHYTRAELSKYTLIHRPLRAKPDVSALFLTDEGTPLSYWGLREVFNELKQYSGITRIGVKIHTCRHTAGTVMHRNGMRLTTLQEVMGHQKLETTKQFYLDISPEDIADEHSQYGPLDNLRAALQPRRVESQKKLRKPLPPPTVVFYLVQESSYRGVGRRYGYSDTAIRNYLKKAGLL